MIRLFQIGTVDSFGLLRRILGLVLVVAAALKAHELVTEPVNDPLWFRLLQHGFIGFELLFGLWLLSGNSPRPTWIAACVFFSVVAGVAAAKALSGAATCGCFGKASLSPWFAFAGDTVAVFFLCAFPPKAGEEEVRTSLST